MPTRQAIAPHPFRAFTLIELMVVVAITAVLLTLAGPEMQTLIAVQRVKTFAYDLAADLTLARSEALKRGQDVLVAPMAGGWSTGWSVTTPAKAPSGAVVQLSQKSDTGVGVSFTQAPSSITFNRNGRLGGTDTVVRFGLSNGEDYKRCISVDPAGRPKTVPGDCPP